ncbi:hypothetical protein [Haloarchaeobius sp. DFWS5]|uniref:hypothetical protein n=1 Tax=Haloarchaeobius sp. DFWS5 TaxID=3446114 RepID=UPI003EB7D810
MKRGSGADDAVLAALTLALVVPIGFAADVDVSTPLLLAAFGGALVLEVVLAFRADLVRRLWTLPSVRPVAVGATVVLALVGAFVAPAVVFSVLWGGLAGYLTLAAFVVAGYLPPSTEWFGEGSEREPGDQEPN